MPNEMMPKDLRTAVKDIKLAILQARARAARASNSEALKLYFFVGGYISKKTRNAKWGSGAIDALSNQLQVELPGLRGFSAANIKYMRIFFDEWARWFEIRHLPSDENPSIGLLLCEKMNKGFVEFAVRDKSKPLGIATYQTLKSIPKPYQTLAPVIDGVRRVLAEHGKEEKRTRGRKLK